MQKDNINIAKFYKNSKKNTIYRKIICLEGLDDSIRSFRFDLRTRIRNRIDRSNKKIEIES